MSRIGRAPITVPAGVTVTVGDDNLITVKGPKGTLTYTAPAAMTVKVEGAVVTVTRPDDEAENRSLHGLTRTLINNMVEGVSKGYEKKLEIVGVGYRVAKEGKRIVLNVGHSHPIYFNEDDKVSFDVPDANTIIVKSFDKQYCGHVAANIRSKRPPEPYHGKGIKYSDEHVRRKAGKTGK
ncbi:MAG: 50S ribosomal protein L6 [Ruminococcaceae bacterium]|nr:50S ribosomal protein L6 [Oscillospiraceae bacterium]